MCKLIKKFFCDELKIGNLIIKRKNTEIITAIELSDLILAGKDVPIPMYVGKAYEFGRKRNIKF